MSRVPVLLRRALRRVATGLGMLVAFGILHVTLAHLLRAPARVAVAPVEIARSPSAPGRASILILGDTGPGDAAEPTLMREGWDFPFRATVDLVRGADLAVANLEMPLTARGTPPVLYKDYVYRARPDAARGLAWAGLDVLTLANNHVVDYGDVGLGDTVATLRDAGLASLGAGLDETEARRGLVATIGEVRVGFLSYCERKWAWDLWVDQFARQGRPGTAALDEEALRADLARLRPRVDVLVVLLHIGYNYHPPTEATVAWSRRAIDLGADLVVSHHPHVAHPMMTHAGRPIALSVGNYAFGTPGHAELDEGYMLFAEIEGRRLDRIELLPIDVQNRRVVYQPRPLAGAALDASLERVIRESRERGAVLERVGDRAVLEVRR